MSTDYPQKPVFNEPPPKSGGKGLMIALIGCAGVGVLGMLLCGGLAFFGVRWGMQQMNAFAQEFEDQGYVKKAGQVIVVDQEISEKTVFVGQILTIQEEVDADIAVFCQVLEIKADIHGDVDFFGQVVKVHPGCVIDGDLRVRAAQVVEIDGEVKGEVTGSYQLKKGTGKASVKGAPKPPTAPAAPLAPPKTDLPPAEAPN